MACNRWISMVLKLIQKVKRIQLNIIRIQNNTEIENQETIIKSTKNFENYRLKKQIKLTYSNLNHSFYNNKKMQTANWHVKIN